MATNITNHKVYTHEITEINSDRSATFRNPYSQPENPTPPSRGAQQAIPHRPAVSQTRHTSNPNPASLSAPATHHYGSQMQRPQADGRMVYNPPNNRISAKQSYQMNRLLDEIPPGMVLLGIPGLEQKAAARNKMHKDALKRRLRELDGRIGGGGW